MKRVLFGTVIALALASCGGGEGEETTEGETPAVDSEAVMEMESATDEVNAALKSLENNVNELDSDVDELLNGI